MDIYGVIITCITAIGSIVSVVLSFIMPDKAPLITGIVGAIITCGNTVCEVIRKYIQTNSAKKE